MLKNFVFVEHSISHCPTSPTLPLFCHLNPVHSLGSHLPKIRFNIASHVHSALKSSFSFEDFISFKCRVRCGGLVQVVSQRLPFATTRVHSNINPCAICGGQNDTGTGFSASTSVWSCQCYSANGPYSLFCLSPVLCNISD
jgi:hypothetical protein